MLHRRVRVRPALVGGVRSAETLLENGAHSWCMAVCALCRIGLFIMHRWHALRSLERGGILAPIACG